MIYIDLGSSFRTGMDGESVSYYNTKIVTTSTGVESGGSFNLGGITGALGVGGVVGSLAGATTLGRSKTSTISTTEQMQRVITIPPHGSKKLSVLKMACAKKMKCIFVSSNEGVPGMTMLHSSYDPTDYALDDGLFKKTLTKPLHLGEIFEFTPETSVGINSYHITYTNDPNFVEMKSITFATYVKFILGVKGWSSTTFHRESRVKNVWDSYMEGDMKDYIFEGYNAYQTIGPNMK